MTVIAKLTEVGITKGKCYDVIGKTNNLIKIVLDDGTIAFRDIIAFDIISNPQGEYHGKRI